MTGPGIAPGFYSSSQKNRSGSALPAIRFWIGQSGGTALDSCPSLVANAPNCRPSYPRGLPQLG